MPFPTQFQISIKTGLPTPSSKRRGRAFLTKNAAVISSLPDNNAVSLLQAWGKEHAKDEVSAREICKLVGGLPLAVRLVGRYLDYAKWYADELLIA